MSGSAVPDIFPGEKEPRRVAYDAQCGSVGTNEEMTKWESQIWEHDKGKGQGRIQDSLPGKGSSRP